MKYKQMPFPSLIAEHERLVYILRHGSWLQIQKLAAEQEAELKEYKEEYRKR